VTKYNFKEFFEQQDTDELLDIARKELTEEAREPQIYSTQLPTELSSPTLLGYSETTGRRR
jgi:hypothetical protein